MCLGAKNPDLCLETGNSKCSIYFLISYSHLQNFLGLLFSPFSEMHLRKKMPIFTEGKTTEGSIVSEVFIANEAAFSWDTLKNLSASNFLIRECEVEDFLQPPAHYVFMLQAPCHTSS